MPDDKNAKQPKEEITKRPNYFAGQYLLEEDFKSEQNYHIDRQRRHNRLLHVSGIAKGLTVSNNQGLTVKVAAGTAFDSQGRQIILLYEKAVDLVEANNKNPIKDGEYTLSVRYSEELTDKQGDDEFTTTRVQEKPEFVLSSSSAKPDDTISLAKLTIKNKKVTIDQNVREYSGINLPTEEGKGVTLRGQVGVPNQVILEGSLSITGGLTIWGASYMGEGLKVEGDLHIVHSLQIGDATESQSVNRIVNKISEGTIEQADEKALITVKAAVDLAETKANKNGNSNEDFTAAQLRVKTLTINQKAVKAICEEIKEDAELENETAIPTIAAIIKYMESWLPPKVVTGVQMTYTIERSEGEKIEVIWNDKRKNIELNFPILLRERIKIIPTGKELSDLTLTCSDEGWKEKVIIKKEKEWWECTVNPKLIEEDALWNLPATEIFKETTPKVIEGMGMNKEEIDWWEKKLRETIDDMEIKGKYDSKKEEWEIERKLHVIELLVLWVRKEGKEEDPSDETKNILLDSWNRDAYDWTKYNMNYKAIRPGEKWNGHFGVMKVKAGEMRAFREWSEEKSGEGKRYTHRVTRVWKAKLV